MLLVRLVRLVSLCLGLALALMQASAQVPVGDVLSSDASVKGSVLLSAGSTSVMSGSSVAAGVSNASVRLIRGGELRVCQGSSVTLTSSPAGHELMVGMSSGTIEAHYPLASVRDSIMTPDFQISLSGPGVFHLAVSADTNGNTCVRSLHGNTGAVAVAELMGDGTYTLKPDEQVFFRAGHIANPGQVAANCGCPPAIAVERASSEPPKPMTNPAASPPPPVAAMMASPPAPSNLTSPPPADRPGDIHVQVEAPFVFRASDPRPVPEAPLDLAHLRLSSLPSIPPVSVQAPQDNPPQVPVEQVAQGKPPKKKRRGFWGFIASIFKG